MVLMEIGAGQGKSIIIAILAAMIMRYTPVPIDTVIIAFPTKLLREKDQELYRKLQQSVP